MKLLSTLDSLDNVQDGSTRKLITKTESSGAGNVVTSVSVSGDTITYTKGATALTSHQNAFSNVKVGSSTVAADQAGDTLELVAGSNITLTPDTTNDKVTIAATDTTYESKSAVSGGTDVSLVTTGEKYTWNNKGSGTITGVSVNGTSVATSGVANITSVPTNILIEPRFQTSATLTTKTLFHTVRANRLAFLPADQIIVEKSTDAGTTWVDAEWSDTTKRNVFSGLNTGGGSIPLKNGVKSTDCMIRMTFTAMKYNVPEGTTETNKYNYWSSTYVKSQERYCTLDKLYFWVNSNSDRIWVKLERANGATPNNWVALFDTSTNAGRQGLNGWSGMNFITFTSGQFGGGTNQTSQPWNYRLTFRTCTTTTTSDATLFDDSKLSTTSTTSAQNITGICGYGDSCWGVANSMMARDHLYTWDIDKNATFPGSIYPTTNNSYNLGSSSYKWANVYATTFNGNLTGTATKATGDKNGDDITTTYYLASNPSGYTSNAGTITGITMNGASKGTSGVVDLGTVATSDTKNTAGSTDTSSKIYLIGATSQADNPQTYSNSKLYYSKGLYSSCLDTGGTSATTINQSTSGLTLSSAYSYTHPGKDASIGLTTTTGAITISGNGGVTITDVVTPTNDEDAANKKYVDDAILALPEPMVFKGSVGTGGTVTWANLPTAAAANEGYTYKVITDHTAETGKPAAKAGDTIISTGSEWVVIPSGDEPSGTVTSITLKATSPIAIDSESAITSSGTRTFSHANSGVTAGTYRSVTVNATGHVTAGTNPTTLSGYGITDAKINNGTITLGSNTITPLNTSYSYSGETGSINWGYDSSDNQSYLNAEMTDGTHTGGIYIMSTDAGIYNEVSGIYVTQSGAQILANNTSNAIDVTPSGVSIVGLVAPTNNNDAANKQYVDNSVVTYTFASGDNNGQIKITPSNGTASNISVTGLSDLAYIAKGSGSSKFLREDGTWQTVSSGSSTDVQINGTSITSSNVANIITNSAYNSSSNKIATMSDLPGNDKVTQQNTTLSSSFRILLSANANDNEETVITRKSSYLTYNPSTKALSTGGTVNGLTLTAATTGFTIAGGTTSKTLTVNETYTLGGACTKSVDTSISAGSSSANLPTSAAVASFVEGKGYAVILSGAEEPTSAIGNVGDIYIQLA